MTHARTERPNPTHNELKHTATRKRRQSTDDTASHPSHTPSATPQPCERAGQLNHHLRDMLRELHRPLRQRLRPLPPLLLHLPLTPHLVKLEAGEAREYIRSENCRDD